LANRPHDYFRFLSWPFDPTVSKRRHTNTVLSSVHVPSVQFITQKETIIVLTVIVSFSLRGFPTKP